jgi:hypothetical protein
MTRQWRFVRVSRKPSASQSNARRATWHGDQLSCNSYQKYFHAYQSYIDAVLSILFHIHCVYPHLSEQGQRLKVSFDVCRRSPQLRRMVAHNSLWLGAAPCASLYAPCPFTRPIER